MAVDMSVLNADLSEHEDPAIAKLWSKVVGFAAPALETYEDIKNSTPPPVSELDKQLQESDDPEVKAYREEIDRLQGAIKQVREQGHQHLLKDFDLLPEDEQAKLRTRFNEQIRQVNTTLQTLTNYANLMDIEGVEEGLKDFTLPTIRGGRPSGGASATTIIRPRFADVKVTVGNKTKSNKRLGEVTAWAAHDQMEVLNAGLEAAGAGKWQDINEEITFEFGNGTYTIVPDPKYAAGADDTESDAA